MGHKWSYARRDQWAFTHVHAANWHPLTTISHMLDCQLYGLHPWGHHLTNILLHAVAAILLFLALRQLTGDLWPSAVGGGHFCCSSAARRVGRLGVGTKGCAQRRVLHADALGLCALRARPRRSLSVHNRRSSFRLRSDVQADPGDTAICFVAPGLLAAAVEVSPLRPWVAGLRRITWTWLVVEKLPLFVLSAASCVATLLAQKQALDASLKPPLVERVGNALVSYVTYVGQMFWPAHLAVLYPYPEGYFESLARDSCVATPADDFSRALFLWRKKYPFLLTGWLWYLGMLVPMIGIVQVGSQVRADRYTYLPQIGLYLLVRLGRDGIVPPMASQPRDPGRRCLAYNNSTNNAQLFSDFLLAGHRNAMETCDCHYLEQLHCYQQPCASPVPIRAI